MRQNMETHSPPFALRYFAKSSANLEPREAEALLVTFLQEWLSTSLEVQEAGPMTGPATLQEMQVGETQIVFSLPISQANVKVQISPDFDQAEGVAIIESALETLKLVRKRDEFEEKQARAQLLDYILESTEDGFWDWNVETGEVEYSNRWKKMLGYEDYDIENAFSSWSSLLHPDDKAEAEAQAAEFLTNPHQDFYSEFRLRCKNGAYKWVLSRGKAVEWLDDKSPRRVVGTHIDIQRQKELEFALREANLRAAQKNTELIRTRDILEKTNAAAKIGHWELDLEKMQVNWSRVTGEIHEVPDGYLPDLEEGINFYKEGWSRNRIAEVFERCVTEGRPYDEELIIVTAKGKEKWVRAIGIPDTNSGAGKRVYGLFQDIDAIKRNQESLDQARSEQALIAQRLELATNAAKIGVWEWVLEDDSLEWDEHLISLYGMEPGEFNNNFSSWERYVHPDDLEITRKKIARALAKEAPFDCEFRIFKQGSELRYLKAIASVIFDENGKPKRMVGVNYDITEQSLAIKAQKEARIAAENANKAKSEFLASMSHEIRTPLNGVLGMLGLALRTNLSQDVQRKLEIAKDSAHTLLTVLNDILDFSKIEAGKLDFEAVEFNLADTLQSVAQSLSIRAEEKGLEIILDLFGLRHTSVIGDSGRLRQILLNLLNNAIKFTPEGQIVIRAGTVEVDSEVVFSCEVVDTGIGIPLEKQGILFDSFTQVDASITRQYGGTGLGLAICKKLCELMGGEIGVNSEPGKGSIFYFKARLKKGSSMLKPQIDKDLRGLKVLVLDDNATNQEVFRCQLEDRGCEISQAYSVDEAYNLCMQNLGALFDVVLVDRHMPQKSGDQFGMLVRGNPALSKMKLVMMTSVSDGKSLEDLYEIGFNGFFTKPVATRDLFDVVSAVVSLNENDNSQFITQGFLQALHSEGVTEIQKWPKQTRILLVEDNQVNQAVAEAMLDDLDLRCDLAANGYEALVALRESSQDEVFTLILMDCQMPEMSGYTATRNIRAGECGEHYTRVPIVALTANAMKGDREECIRAGMDDYLAKPLEPEMLEACLRRWLLPLQTADRNVASIEKEPMLELPCWDQENFYRRFRKNRQRAKRVADSFNANSPDMLARLQENIQAQDAWKIQEAAHELKGVAANLGAMRMQALCSEIEEAAKRESLEGLLPCFGLLQSENQRFSEVLQQHFGPQAN